MIKNLFSILIGVFLAAFALLLVLIYSLIGLLARVLSLLLMPIHLLLGKSTKPDFE